MNTYFWKISKRNLDGIVFEMKVGVIMSTCQQAVDNDLRTFGFFPTIAEMRKNGYTVECDIYLVTENLFSCTIALE